MTFKATRKVKTPTHPFFKSPALGDFFLRLSMNFVASLDGLFLHPRDFFFCQLQNIVFIYDVITTTKLTSCVTSISGGFSGSLLSVLSSCCCRMSMNSSSERTSRGVLLLTNSQNLKMSENKRELIEDNLTFQSDAYKAVLEWPATGHKGQ